MMMGFGMDGVVTRRGLLHIDDLIDLGRVDRTTRVVIPVVEPLTGTTILPTDDALTLLCYLLSFKLHTAAPLLQCLSHFRRCLKGHYK